MCLQTIIIGGNNTMRRPKRLEVRNVAGAGMQIHADIPSTTYCVEFTMKKGFQMIATEPWVQFPPKEWKEMLETVFNEMVELWNEKHAIDNAEEGQTYFT